MVIVADGWLNLLKPRGISSAKIVSTVKKNLQYRKVGHTGTLDVEAEGVLPIAFGQATKLANILVNSEKEYIFTIKFGAKTSTADASGEIVKKTNIIPKKNDCEKVCNNFIGEIKQKPPAYSALKINGVRAYKLARENKQFEIKDRFIKIYNLKLLRYSAKNKTARYLVSCSKGTYVRSLAEDISLSLHSLGFVIELRRTRVGIFDEQNAFNILDSEGSTVDGVCDLINKNYLKIEKVLDDIPVLEVDNFTAQKIRYGQHCVFDELDNVNQIWLKHNDKILAIGNLSAGNFKSSRVFNL